jgi:hypothetical protein
MSSIPEPLLFNPLKHHLGYIKEYIRQFSRDDMTILKSYLQTIGDSQMDLYTGALSIDQISYQILIFINDSLLSSKSIYVKFINELIGYCMIAISDGSKWILREGLNSERYIHFHPARYSPNTVRIKANTLKSLIAAHIIHKNHVGLPEINQVRSEILQLPPLKQLSQDIGISKHIRLLHSFSSIHYGS